MNDLYINKCKSFVDFMITQQQWSGLTKNNVDSWLSNFNGLSLQEQKLIYKLLVNVLYFSENDITDALRIGIYNCLSYKDILEKQVSSGFSTSTHTLEMIHKSNIEKTCFVPLLDSKAPYESANGLCRVLVQQNIIPQNNVMFIDKVTNSFKQGNANNLVIVDDCVGSGDQITSFWENTEIIDEGTSFSIEELCVKYNATANYLTLFGYDKNINELRTLYPSLKITCVRELSDQHRVFSDCSYIWESEDERKQAYELIDSIAKNAGINTLGHKGLDFAFIMHKTIPDWSLPIFWKENCDWKLLLRRKNSND